MKSRFKLPYEPPQIIDLGGVAHAAKPTTTSATTTVGVQCNAGGSPAQDCNVGSSASEANCTSGNNTGLQCLTGATPSSTVCRTGGVAGGSCTTGTLATGGQCRDGSAAMYSCKTGGVPA